MSYKLKLNYLKSKAKQFEQKVIRKLTGKKYIGDNRLALIQKYVSGRSFVDVGCMWDINGKFCFLAEEAGATRVVGVDVYPATEAFLAEKANRKSIVEFVQGDINQQSTLEQIGQCDVVFCSGVLYHTPNPVHMLSRLRAICKETLILDTSMIPEMPEIKNGAVFYPFLPEEQRKLWDRGIGRQKAITGPYEPESGYGNWFWGFTPSCLESMLECAGFQTIERFYEPFRGRVVCRAVEVKFAPVSGDWSSPQDLEVKQFVR